MCIRDSWSSVHHATESLLTAFSSTVDIGVQLFPSAKAKDQDGLACLVANSPEVPAGPDNSAAILAKLPPKDAPLAGGSALRKGLVSAISHLESTALDHPLVITIITDGMSNCAPEAEDPLDKKALYETYDTQLPDVFNYVNNTSRATIVVVGVDVKDEFTSAEVDGSPDEVNPFQELNFLSTVGQWPSSDPDHPDQLFHDVRDEPALIASLSALLTEIRSCVYTIDPVPGDTDLLEVTINGVVYPKPVSCLQCDDPGWRYVKPDRSQIRLYGAHCPLSLIHI